MRANRLFVLGCAAALGGCGVGMLDAWDGRPVIRRHVAAPADVLWERLSRRAGELGLIVSEIRPEDRVIVFDWITAPGDGRLYLRCRAAGTIGSASLRPRVSIDPAPDGSSLVIGSQVRATTTSSCESTGQLEGWLLDRLEPAIDAAVDDAAPDDDARN